ncbi:hypothetical protein BDF20DRAFT_903958 [Mycotypha africana]|uniref:uncharacterized protein n=1 Tax=Mycotypha africana TaxID=64632 RepID=UPI0023013878|nr:uncharacterized protein BDF20DRAFT_903958 [Mycotypha africana]KAI8991138.1 hypothetical protein BDF20DRAFT_903958 [Mycotypha africana]
MGFVSWVMLANFEPSQTYGQNRLTIYFIVPLMVGFVVMFCMNYTIQLYLMLLGGLGGLAFGLWILGWKSDLAITSSWGRAVFLTVWVVVCMMLSLYSCFWHKMGAAVAGSYLFFMGLDIFFHTGFLYCITTTLDANPNHAHRYEVYRGVYIMQACLIISFMITYIFQSLGHRPEHIRLQHSVVMDTMKNPLYKSHLIPTQRFIPAGMVRTGWRSNWPFFGRTVVPPPPPPPAPVAAVV